MVKIISQSLNNGEIYLINKSIIKEMFSEFDAAWYNKVPDRRYVVPRSGDNKILQQAAGIPFAYLQFSRREDGTLKRYITIYRVKASLVDDTKKEMYIKRFKELAAGRIAENAEIYDSYEDNRNRYVGSKNYLYCFTENGIEERYLHTYP